MITARAFYWTLSIALFLMLFYGLMDGTSSKSDSDQSYLDIPEITVDKAALTYDHKVSLWLKDGQPFSGYAVLYYPDGSLKEKVGILKGKKENASIQWYPDQHFKNITYYQNGKLHGEKKTWTRDAEHILIAHYQFEKGKAHGEQKKWYPTGELFKILNMNMGKEDGLQRAFRKNGDLFANYEAKEGRIFGLKKAALCYGLEDENINPQSN